MILIALEDTGAHLQRRRPCQRAFTPAAIKDYEAQLARRTSQLVARLEEQLGKVRLGEWLEYFTCVTSLRTAIVCSREANRTRVAGMTLCQA